MEGVTPDSAFCIALFLDLKSVYNFLRSHKRTFALWTEDYLWRDLMSRAGPSILTLYCGPDFSIDDICSLRTDLWTSAIVDDAKQFVKSVVENFSRISVVNLQCVNSSSTATATNIEYTVSYAKDLLWASPGALVNHSSEYLMYKWQQPVFLYWVEVQLYCDFKGHIYPPNMFRVKLGMNSTHWNYISQPVAASPVSTNQVLVVFPQLVPCQCLQLDLLGALQRSHHGNLFTVAVSKVRCVGLPVAADSLLPAVTSPQVTLQNFHLWTQVLIYNRLLVHRGLLDEIRQIGKLRDYFCAVSVQMKDGITRCEARYIMDYYEEIKGIFTFQFIEKHCPPEIGKVLFAKGEFADALRIFTLKKDARMTATAALILEDYRKCAELVETGATCMQEICDIADATGRDLRACFEQYMKKRQEPKRKRRKKHE